MFSQLGDKLQDIFKDLRGHGAITETNINDALRQVRLALLEAATTELRLRRLEGLLGRDIDLLNRDLKPLVIDARGAAGRLN
jgi:hypothetical protein